MDDISIFDLQQTLASALGIAGARRQIVNALHRGEIRAKCKSFVGLNARDFTVGDYPESAENFTLPPAFWSRSGWIEDGEQMGNQPDDRNAWSTNTSWARGEFALSGSRRRGTVPFVRRAVGVSIHRSETRGFLRRFGVAMPGSEEEMTAWAVSWIRERNSRRERHGERAMTPEFLDQFPSANRKRIRAVHTEAKRILGI
ncbi:hypothetical protein [Sphingopyxis sp.]|uniref:hypothetical protein n=1 Tax=Sphingopyxis sp. TaxID=1908224 RepID=UPI001DB958BC|nr:hypothetical protein [Sphingopyxis sp.]MBW8296177.1 hypothetical protein [Sphingopyxis sp.]